MNFTFVLDLGWSNHSPWIEEEKDYLSHSGAMPYIPSIAVSVTAAVTNCIVKDYQLTAVASKDQQ